MSEARAERPSATSTAAEQDAAASAHTTGAASGISAAGARQAASLHGAGHAFVLGVRGLVAKELRSRSRGWRPMWLLTAYLALLTLGVAGFLALNTGAHGIVSTHLGMQLYSTLAVGAVVLLAFITPALTAGAISGERERRTLDLLLVTRASPLGLAAGKLAGSLLYVVYLLLASLPAFALVYLFGGVPPRYLAMVFVVAVATALGFAALGLLLSALLRRTLFASVVAYLIVLGLVFGVPFVAMVSGIANARDGGGMPLQVPHAGVTRPGLSTDDRAPAHGLLPPGAYLYLSPLPAAMSVLPTAPFGGAFNPAVHALGASVSAGYGSYGVASSYAYGYQAFSPPAATPSGALTHSAYVLRSDPQTGQVDYLVALAPWAIHALVSVMFAVVALLLTALLLAPAKPWRAWRSRQRAARATA